MRKGGIIVLLLFSGRRVTLHSQHGPECRTEVGYEYESLVQVIFLSARINKNIHVIKNKNKSTILDNHKLLTTWRRKIRIKPKNTIKYRKEISSFMRKILEQRVGRYKNRE